MTEEPAFYNWKTMKGSNIDNKKMNNSKSFHTIGKYPVIHFEDFRPAISMF